MFSASIGNVKRIEFGKCDQWATGEAKLYDRERSYWLTVYDANGVALDLRIDVNDSNIVPTINSQITDAKNKPVGDWITDGIDGINLELPPIDDYSQPAATPMTSKQKLVMASRLLREVADDDTEYLTARNFARIDVAADSIDSAIATIG